MATTGVGFRWLDILEKEFDKACVELDTSITELEAEEPEVVFGARQKIATLSSCFSQLTHKALTIFQNSAKLEAELVDMRAELVQARAASSGGLLEAGAGTVPEAARARSEAAQLARENAALRETVLALHSELFGARLATKYLDKELAGRIQQLQLLGREMRAELRDSLWAQVEAEILLQRHKTLVRVCRGVSPRPPRPPAPRDARSRPRTVRVRRSPHLGLGISVTGGREHGVPILISELEAGGPAALTGDLYVGDAILAINDVDLTQACHKEAVQALQSVKGDCQLCVQFIATDDDDRLSEDNYRFPLYPEEGEVFGAGAGVGDGEGEGDGSGATPTAPRTPDYTHRADSELESDNECVAGLPYNDPALGGGSVLPPSYPDYSAINNKLSILDISDDCIKVETRLEQVVRHVESPVGSPEARRRRRGPYRGLAGSSAESQGSTPVHARRGRRKRRPDWRAKGTYTAVDDEHSSEEDTLNHTPQEPSPVAESQCGVPTVFVPEVPIDISRPPLNGLNVRPLSDNTNGDEKRPVSNGEDQRQEQDKRPTPNGDPRLINNGDPRPTYNGDPRPTTNGDQRPTNNGDPRPPTNSEHKPPPRRESKGFRIGSARRVTEHLPYVNGDVEKSKFPICLLAGEGDPDFGTPV